MSSPSPSDHTDITIIGAGLAGLSMAVRLADTQFAALKIRILDPRTTLVGNKTWCAWRLHAHPFADCVSAHWTHGIISDARRGANAKAALDFSTCPYEHVTEQDLIDYALPILARAPHVSLHLGESVISINTAEVTNKDDSTFESTIHTQSRTFTSRLVLDSRPPDASVNAWRQVFFGGEYRLSSQHARDDRSTFTMMAMQAVPRGSGCAFVYVLPLSHDRSLIQATAFVPPNGDVTLPWEAMIKEYAEHEGIVIHDLLRAEHGVIAMDADVAPTSALTPITNIGARGGFVRASTGYSFSRTQRACDAIAQAIGQWAEDARQKPISIDWQSAAVPMLDRTFLRALQREDVDSADLFWRLARATNGDTLARFLDGEPTARDLASVVAAMPTFPFLVAGLQESLTKLTARA
jgi:lycopene beta-cyclase